MSRMTVRQLDDDERLKIACVDGNTVLHVGARENNVIAIAQLMRRYDVVL